VLLRRQQGLVMVVVVVVVVVVVWSCSLLPETMHICGMYVGRNLIVKRE
jgi:hypothetical protein